MDWKLTYDYDDILILKCTTIGDNRARELTLDDMCAQKRAEIKQLDEKIEVVYELQLESEERLDEEPCGVFVLSREVNRLKEIRDKLQKEWRQLHEESRKEQEINYKCRKYYHLRREVNRVSTFQIKE